MDLMIANKELYIHSGIAEMGATEFFRALSAVCMGISQSCGNNTDAEKAAKSQWLNASTQMAKMQRSMTQAGLTSPFVVRRLGVCPRTQKQCDDQRCSPSWCQREEHYP